MAPILHPKVGCARPSSRRDDAGTKVTLDTGMSEKPNQSLTRDAIRSMRRSYGDAGLENLPGDPLAAFSSWLAEAAANEYIVEANAMVLSTLGANEEISTRTVLLKDISEGGFTFFTNYQSRKAHAIEMHDRVSVLFPWYAMERQVSITGVISKIADSESEEYFATRPWSSQIGAWASAQSQPLESRAELESRFAGASAKWPEGTTVPRPPHWGGYRIAPLSIEFWQGRYSRLHDRLRYERQTTDSEFVLTRYYP
jgi:pyridoxamine 5'-phosphate oxidase